MLWMFNELQDTVDFTANKTQEVMGAEMRKIQTAMSELKSLLAR